MPTTPDQSEAAPATYEIAGRTVTMPCMVRDASAGTAMFDVDLAAARALVPAPFVPVETADGRCQLVIAVIDYRDNDLGDYLEVGLTFFVTPDGDSAESAGTFITRLPVDQAFTCEAGRTIWGFPKTVEDIVLDRTDSSATCELRMDGELVLRLTLPRGGSDEMPPMPMTSYTIIGGAPHATAFTQGGQGSQVVAGGDGVTIELGEHPVAKELAALGLPAPAQMSTWTEHMQGRFEAPVLLSPS
ncbi:MAG: acetoacetate decarboxylase family protein [Acidimicrobiales bacterium]|nr:acetoacetate decarboxylase family protein [Acidimicrobiales bacterium]